MTNNLPDNWDPTEGEEIVPVRSAVAPTFEDKNTQTVSRKPAAIFGISLVMLASISFFYGLDALRGQLAEPNIPNTEDLIVIGVNGIVPAVFYAKPGETLTWINEQDIPHYLVSDTLCNTAGTCMSTTTMFPEMEVTYDIPLSVTPGNYSYYSPTDPTLEGTIIIENSPGNTILPIDLENAQSSEPETINEPVVQNPPSQLAMASSSSSNTSGSGTTIEKNPLLESIEKQLEQDRNGINTVSANSPTTIQNRTSNTVPGVPQNPYASSNQQYVPQGIDSGNTNTNLLGSTTQKPFTQPNTGTGSWIAGILVLLSLCIIGFKINKREVLYK